MIYLDNAATSFPKPREVLTEMIETYSRMGCSPGRGGYDLAVTAEEFVERTRIKTAGFFNAPDPERVIFTANATEALNICLQGFLKPGDHVLSTRLEHNSVLRPLYYLKESNVIEYELVPFNSKGFIDPDELAQTIRPTTSLVAVSHASNVLGTIQPVEAIGRICADRGIPLLIDAAQSAGQVPIDMKGWRVSALAFTGHKSLLAPTGTGGLILSPEMEVDPTRFGGTGVDSRNLVHTPTYPHRLEAGTLNIMGIIGLSAALDHIDRLGLIESHRREMDLVERLNQGLSELSGVTVYGNWTRENHVPVLTCNVEDMGSEDAGAILDGDYDVAVRTGLHCAPLVHEDLNTTQSGAIRFSPGIFNTEDDIDRALAAMRALAGG